MKNIKNLILVAGAALLALTPTVSHGSVLDESDAIEIAGISFRGLKICHQNEWRNLTVNFEYTAEMGGTASDIQAVKQHIRSFLEKYSNPEDFWEIMNTKLVHSISEAFPDIMTMKSSLSLSPDRTLKFPRKSIVSYDRETNQMKESFQFTKLNYLICRNSFRSLDLNVEWNVRENPDQTTDYPDYQWVDEAMETFFQNHPVSISEWKSLKPQLQHYLLDKFPTLTSIDVEIKIVE